MRRALLVAGVLLAACDHTHPHLLPPESQSGGSWPMQGGDRARSSWNSAETLLTPQTVASGNFGLLWESAPIGGTSWSQPLYVDGLNLIVVAAQSGVFGIDAEDGSTRWMIPFAATAAPLIDL